MTFERRHFLMDDQALRQIIESVVIEHFTTSNNMIPVGISNRHVHLSPDHISLLFGPDYLLTKQKDLSQPGQFAARELVTLIGPKGVIEGVRILGPARQQSQVEILKSDSFKLGVESVFRESGDIRNTPGIVLAGPGGIVKLNCGVIVAKRHIHATPLEAERLTLKDRDVISLNIQNERSLVFSDTLVRVDPFFKLEFHIDFDEANAANLKNGDFVEIVR